MKVNGNFLNGGKCVHREQHNVLGELSSIWYFDLWPVGWAAGKWSHRVKADHCRKGLGPPAQGIRGLEFTLWVLRGYGKILSKKFLHSNHTDCVYSWQNSLLKSQTSCQLLSGPQQMTIVSRHPHRMNPTDDSSALSSLSLQLCKENSSLPLSLEGSPLQ